MKRRFIWQIIVFALVYYLLFFVLDGLIFLLAHIPPKAVNLDSLLLRLGEAEQLLAWPRFVLRCLWPGETTPTSFNYILPVLNCLVWGLTLTSLKALWIHVRK